MTVRVVVRPASAGAPTLRLPGRATVFRSVADRDETDERDALALLGVRAEHTVRRKDIPVASAVALALKSADDSRPNVAFIAATLAMTLFPDSLDVQSMAMATMASALVSSAGVVAARAWGVAFIEWVVHRQVAKFSTSPHLVCAGLAILWRLAACDRVNADRLVDVACDASDAMLETPSVALWSCLSIARCNPAHMSDDTRHRAWLSLNRMHEVYASNDLINDALVPAMQRHAAL